MVYLLPRYERCKTSTGLQDEHGLIEKKQRGRGGRGAILGVPTWVFSACGGLQKWVGPPTLRTVAVSGVLFYVKFLLKICTV